MKVTQQTENVATYLGLPRTRKVNDFIHCADLSAENPKLTPYKLAQLTGLAVNTIKKWMREEAFLRRFRDKRYELGKLDQGQLEAKLKWKQFLRQRNDQ